jgi:hypothetical protein
VGQGTRYDFLLPKFPPALLLVRLLRVWFKGQKLVGMRGPALERTFRRQLRHDAPRLLLAVPCGHKPVPVRRSVSACLLLDRFDPLWCEFQPLPPYDIVYSRKDDELTWYDLCGECTPGPHYKDGEIGWLHQGHMAMRSET